MNNNLFVKYFMTFVIILLITFTIFGILMFGITNYYAASESQDSLLNVAGQVSSMTKQMVKSYPFNWEYRIKDLINFYSDISGLDIFIIDNSNNIVFACDNITYDQLEKIDSNLIQTIISSNKYYMETGKFNGFYNTAHYIVGAPVYVNGGETASHLVFVTTKANNVYKMANDFSTYFFFCALLSLSVAFISIYYLTRRFTSPIKQMNKVAKEYAKGNFDEKVEIKSNDEIGQLAATLNDMSVSLNSLEQLRRSFVANVSHELRTPMTTISGFVDGIRDGTIPTEKQEFYLDIVSDEIKRMSRLVASLLDISKIESGDFIINKSKFDICSLVGKAALNFEKECEKKDLDVQIVMPEDGITVEADEDCIYRVVYNLIENAVKYSKEKGRIIIKVEDSPKTAYISVYNTGKGIKKEDLPFVFERFYKSDKSRSLDTKSLGLGLYMVKSLITAHDEKIWATSEYGSYAEFIFTLKKPY